MEAERPSRGILQNISPEAATTSTVFGLFTGVFAYFSWFLAASISCLGTFLFLQVAFLMEHQVQES